MRPIKVGPLSPVTASTTAFNAQTWTSTGAAAAVSNPVTPDSLMHQVTLTSPVQATLAGINFTILGTDADGNVKSETIAGPASASTVTTTGYFESITSIQPSATMGGLLLSVGIAAVGITQTIPLDWRSIVAATHDVDVSGTINFSMQETFDNPYNARPETLDWGSYTTALSAKTATAVSPGFVGAQGVRVMVNSVTNGATLTWRIVQPVNLSG